MELNQYRERYQRELFESIVPFWLKHSVDPDFGGYFTCLDRDGKVYDTRKYVWLQGRQVWTLARLYNRVERRPEWIDAARSGAEFLQRYALDPGGRCYFSLTREGTPWFFQRKPYAAAFIALGFLEYARASGQKSFQEQSVELFWRIRSWIEFPGMLGRPVLNGVAPSSKLADVLVSGALALELYEALGDPRYFQFVQRCLDDALLHLDPERQIFLENVAPNGAKRLDTPEGRLFSPGHSIEMASLLLEILRRSPHANKQEQVLKALEASLEYGWDPEYGGLYYFMDIQNKPMLVLESTMKLWWPHTEAIYAVILAYSMTGERKWLDWLARLDDYVFRHFADSSHGEWFGYCDRRGTLTSTCKGSDYKGMYHLPRCLLQSIETIERCARSVAAGA